MAVRRKKKAATADEQPAPSFAGPISQANLSETAPPVESWPKWRKVALASAIRVHGPFVVDTSEGPLSCEDGWLAVDARGYPYPIAADEFELIYEPAGGGLVAPSDAERLVAAVREELVTHNLGLANLAAIDSRIVAELGLAPEEA